MEEVEGGAGKAGGALTRGGEAGGVRRRQQRGGVPEGEVAGQRVERLPVSEGAATSRTSCRDFRSQMHWRRLAYSTSIRHLAGQIASYRFGTWDAGGASQGQTHADLTCRSRDRAARPGTDRRLPTQGP